MKSFRKCPHCKKDRWGSETHSQETEHTYDSTFVCSYCMMVTEEKGIVDTKPKGNTFHFYGQAPVWN